MKEHKLWQLQQQWLTDYEWVDLSHEMSPETPHWSGFPAMVVEQKFDYPDGFYAHAYTTVGQYGTHVDAPSHFVQGARMLHELRVDEMVLPLCVIDVREKIVNNDDYVVTVQDVLDWEAVNGRIPERSFVAICTDWSKRDDLDNCDAEGNKHYPGWGMDVLKFLTQERHIHAIGHEASDTDSTAESSVTGNLACEYYILSQDCYQIELMRNLDKVPATGSLIFCGFPSVKDAGGFPARCIALCPKE